MSDLKKDMNNDATLANGASMEDILSSIRQAMHETPETPAQTPPNTEDILDLHKTAPTPPQYDRWENANEPEPVCSAETLLSAEAEIQTRQALSSLNEEIQRKQRSEVEQAYFAIERMLRPILTEWCNKNLPDIVTRSVQKEIKALVQSLTQKRNG
ncbi:MAG: DUF2497 domain-containing protein [Alphaproteobacteria bacterium]|nr:DUF2497 domain-containing protein [Alphaproteobacteria bacterium]